MLLATFFYTSCSEVDMMQDHVYSYDDELAITVNTVPFLEERNSLVGTRVANEAHETTFEEGDVIGVYAVQTTGTTTEVVLQNVPVELKNGKWVATKYDERYVKNIPGAKYFAYYPYDANNNNKTYSDVQSLVDAFEPKDNQQEKADYIASDLLTSQLVQVTGSTTSPQLVFTMKHSMACVGVFFNDDPDKYLFFPVPAKYSSDSRYIVKDKMYAGFGMTKNDDGSIEQISYRYLVKPGSEKVLAGYASIKEKNEEQYLEDKYKDTIDAIYHRHYFFERLEPSELVAGSTRFLTIAGSSIENYKIAVDMELPSGNKWAPYNLDAIYDGWNIAHSEDQIAENTNKDTAGGEVWLKMGYDRGDYYAWGEMKPKYGKGYFSNNYENKDTYNWAPIGGDISAGQRDVVHARNWKGEWHIPTKADFQELLDNCTITYEGQYQEPNTRYNGNMQVSKTVIVYRFTSKINGKYIFFAGGGCADGNFDGIQEGNAGLDMYYLTGTASESKEDEAVYLEILRTPKGTGGYNISAELKDGKRYKGMLIRPVYKRIPINNEYKEN